MMAGNLVGAGAVSLGFAAYLRHFVDIDARLIAVVLLLVLTGIVSTGVRIWIWLTTALVALEVGGLLLVIFVGVPHIGDRSLVEGTPTGVLSAATLVFFAFIGFDEVVTLSDETKDPARVIPRELLLALGISTALYAAVAVAAVSTIDWHELAASERPLGLVLDHQWGGRASTIIAWLVLASTTSTTLLLLTASARLIYDMARKGSLPAVLGTVSSRAHAPYVATAVSFAIAAAFAWIGRLGLVAAVTDFSVYAVFIAVNLAVLRLRRTLPGATRRMRACPSLGGWPVAPVLGLLAPFLMIAFLDRTAWAIGGGVTAAGVVLWLTRRGRARLA